MPDERTVAAVLLVLAPLVCLVPVAYPPLLGIWTASRETHLATVVAHRRAWALLNAGFAGATVLSAAGIVLLAVGSAGVPQRVAFVVGAAGYTSGGVLWVVVLAIRTRTTPLLGEWLASNRDHEPGEALLGAATGGLFAAFTVLTSLALVLVAVAVASTATAAGVAAGAVAALVAAVTCASQLRTGDSIPAVLYLPTLIVGIAVLAGWA